MRYKYKFVSGWVFKVVMFMFVVYWLWVFFGNVYWFEDVDLWEILFNFFVDEWFGVNNNFVWLLGVVVVVVYLI